MMSKNSHNNASSPETKAALRKLDIEHPLRDNLLNSPEEDPKMEMARLDGSGAAWVGAI